MSSIVNKTPDPGGRVTPDLGTGRHRVLYSGSDRGQAPVSRRRTSLCTSIWRFSPVASDGLRIHGPCQWWAVLGGGHLRRWSQGRGTPEPGPKGHRQLSGSPGPTLLILFCCEKRTWRGNLFPPHVSIRRLRISTIPLASPARFLPSPAMGAAGCFRAPRDIRRGPDRLPAAPLSPVSSLQSWPPRVQSPPADGSRHARSVDEPALYNFQARLIP